MSTPHEKGDTRRGASQRPAVGGGAAAVPVLLAVRAVRVGLTAASTSGCRSASTFWRVSFRSSSFSLVAETVETLIREFLQLCSTRQSARTASKRRKHPQ